MSNLDDFLRDHPECESARDALLSWQHDLDRLRQEKTELVNSNETLTERIADLEREIALMKDVPEGFISSSGVLWLVGAGGSIEKLAYCPTCKLVMTPFPSDYPEHLVCTVCKFKAPFEYSKLDQVWSEVTK
jgi:hypothetical protein